MEDGEAEETDVFLIFSGLPFSDLLRSALVCKHWSRSVADVFRHRPTLPILWSLDHQPDQIYSISDRRFYSISLPPEIDDSVAVDAIHEDWIGLLTYPDHRYKDNNPISYFLYNPFSAAIIQLPKVGPCPEWPQISPQIKFSCNPSEPGCLAAYFIRPSEGIGFWKVGDVQSDWQMIPCNESRYQNIAFLNNLIYLVDLEGGLDVADPVTREIRSVIPPPIKKHFPEWLSAYLSMGNGIKLGAYFIFSCGDELFMVCMSRGGHFSGGNPIAIYCANFESKRWEMVENLKGQVLLMEPSHSLLCIRPNELFGLKGNCFYVLGQNNVDRKFRVFPQLCDTFNLIPNGYHDDDDDDNEDDGDDFYLLHPSFFDNMFFHVLTPKPKFLTAQTK